MDRLTYRGSEIMTEDGWLKPSYSNYSTGRIIERLAEYEDAEEQGRLISLPCKVGDTVYHVVQGRIVEVSNVDLFFLLLSVVENRFNNSVFLTKEEAEQKLKEQKLKEMECD